MRCLQKRLRRKSAVLHKRYRIGSRDDALQKHRTACMDHAQAQTSAQQRTTKIEWFSKQLRETPLRHTPGCARGRMTHAEKVVEADAAVDLALVEQRQLLAANDHVHLSALELRHLRAEAARARAQQRAARVDQPEHRARQCEHHAPLGLA
eukprot:4153295-Pleurochrysis_carterae.AAC.1